jgi:hypothetical protein
MSESPAEWEVALRRFLAVLALYIMAVPPLALGSTWQPIRLIIPTPDTLLANSAYLSLAFPVLGTRAIALHFTSEDSGKVAATNALRILFSNVPDTLNAPPHGVFRGDTARYFPPAAPGAGNYGSVSLLQGLSDAQYLCFGGAVVMATTSVSGSGAASSPWSGCNYRFARVQFTPGAADMKNVSCMAYGLYGAGDVSGGGPLSNSTTATVSIASTGVVTVTSGDISSVPIGALINGFVGFNGIPLSSTGNSALALCTRVIAKSSASSCTIAPWAGTATGTATFIW